jgi:hypothetical protein
MTRTNLATIFPSRTRACRQPRCRCTRGGVAPIAQLQRYHRGPQRLHIDHVQIAALSEVTRPRPARRRCRRTCRQRSCARSCRARPRGRRSCIRSRGRPRPQPRLDAAVAHAEALAGHAADVGLAAGRAVEGDVADDDVVLGTKVDLRRRIDDDLAAGQPLAEVVVGVAFELSVMPLGTKAPKLWPAEPWNLSRMVSSGSPRAVAPGQTRCPKSCRPRG